MTGLPREGGAKAAVSNLAGDLLQLLAEIQRALETHSFAMAAGRELARSNSVRRLQQILHSPSYFELLGHIMGANGEAAALNFQQRLNATLNATLNKFLQTNDYPTSESLAGVPLSKQRAFHGPHMVIHLLRGQISSAFRLHGQAVGNEASSVADKLTAEKTEDEPPVREDGNRPTAQEARNKLGELLLEAFDLNRTKNLKLQEAANDLIEKHFLPLPPYDSQTGNGVAELYKRAYLGKYGTPWTGDRRGKGKSK